MSVAHQLYISPPPSPQPRPLVQELPCSTKQDLVLQDRGDPTGILPIVVPRFLDKTLRIVTARGVSLVFLDPSHTPRIDRRVDRVTLESSNDGFVNVSTLIAGP